MVDNDGAACSVDDLLALIRTEDGFVMLPDSDMDLVYPGIFVGDISGARNRFTLEKKHITHILNTAGGDERAQHYNTHGEPDMYNKLHIKCLTIDAEDETNFPLKDYFQQAADFIDEAVEANGKILVHCIEGVSRSATVVIAYFMIKRHLPVSEAVKIVREGRLVCPNDGFLQQLCDLNDELNSKGHFRKEGSDTV